MSFLGVMAFVVFHSATGSNLVQNSGFELGDSEKKGPIGYELTGKARWEETGYADETHSLGVSLDAFGSDTAGSLSQMVSVDRTKGKWVTFRFRARAEDGFVVDKDALSMRMDFYADGGMRFMETAKRLVYREITKDRRDLAMNGNGRKSGAWVWRTYELEELLPFKDVDAVKVSVAFEHGNGKVKNYSRFQVDDFEVVQADQSATGRVDPADAARPMGEAPTDTKGMISLGGRWYYRPADGEEITVQDGKLAGPLKVNRLNADRLFYKNDRLGNPFAANMTAWMLPGYKDYKGNIVQNAQFVEDNVRLTFDGTGWLTLQSRNIPNHPTAKFPDTLGTQGYAPGYIQEQNSSYRIPVDPQVNPKAVVMTTTNSNMGLNMGPIGFAVNGVVFFNPFDGNMTDATNIMDRCCGHPTPQVNQYHYHKYPICVNTPFVDKGEGHSPLIGFALDGFPVYGPYEAKDQLARDLKSNALNGLNAHSDSIRGWHYHVTPGKFPYIIGGYLGSFARRSG